VIDPRLWEVSANEKMEEAWFEEGYNITPSFWVRMFEAWNNKRSWRHIVRFLPPGNRLLEIGVGSGSFLNFMKDKGFDVTGCDLSRTICEHVNEKFGISIYNGFVADSPSNVQYDLVVMNHVLEHVNEPIKLLNDLRIRMKADSLLQVAVPNVASWEAKLPGWTSYEPYHLIYFTPETLQRTLEKAGFRVISLKTHESFSGWFLAILRTLLKANQNNARERKHQYQNRSNTWIEHLYRMAMVISGGLSFPIRSIQGSLGFGDEIVIIARPDNL
jgi:2-polyprenyl-3-methyl-5-hydroxy-6-metoxy-1,4-benzoquinol methylase